MDSNEKVLQKPKTENLYFISGQADFLKLYELKQSKCWKKKQKKTGYLHICLPKD